MMNLVLIIPDRVKVGDQICWMPQRPMYEHGISRSILEFGFISTLTPEIGVRLWKHNEYHHYDIPYEAEDHNRFLPISELYQWRSLSQSYITNALKTINGE